ncbi:hypothetical protein ATR1_375d0001, partial [Acetobacter tropicalis]
MHQAFQKKIELDVLSVASEFFPLVKTGGLGDVTGALPGALAPQGVRVRTVLPGYPSVMSALKWSRREGDLVEITEFGHAVRIHQVSIYHNYFFILDCPELYLRSGSPYTAGNGKSWDDNGLRFALLSRVAARLACGLLPDYRRGNLTEGLYIGLDYAKVCFA